MADNFNLAKFLRNNRLLNESIGGYRDIKPLREDETNEGHYSQDSFKDGEFEVKWQELPSGDGFRRIIMRNGEQLSQDEIIDINQNDPKSANIIKNLWKKAKDNSYAYSSAKMRHSESSETMSGQYDPLGEAEDDDDQGFELQSGFEAEYGDLVAALEEGAGWIDPDYVEDTWENSSDIPFESIASKLYAKLFVDDFLYNPNDEDPGSDVPGEKVTEDELVERGFLTQDQVDELIYNNKTQDHLGINEAGGKITKDPSSQSMAEKFKSIKAILKNYPQAKIDDLEKDRERMTFTIFFTEEISEENFSELILELENAIPQDDAITSDYEGGEIYVELLTPYMGEAEEERAYFDYKNNRRSFLPSPDEFQGALDSSEMSKHDFMMGLADEGFDKDVSAIVSKTIEGLIKGGFGAQDIVDFLATDFSLDEGLDEAEEESGYETVTLMYYDHPSITNGFVNKSIRTFKEFVKHLGGSAKVLENGFDEIIFTLSGISPEELKEAFNDFVKAEFKKGFLDDPSPFGILTSWRLDLQKGNYPIAPVGGLKKKSEVDESFNIEKIQMEEPADFTKFVKVGNVYDNYHDATGGFRMKLKVTAVDPMNQTITAVDEKGRERKYSAYQFTTDFRAEDPNPIDSKWTDPGYKNRD